MDLTYYMSKLPNELKQIIYWKTIEGSTNKIFKEFIKENELFKFNVSLQNLKPNPHYTLAQFLMDCNIAKRYNMYHEDILYDIEDLVNFIMENHVEGGDHDSGDDFSDSEEEEEEEESDGDD